MRIRFTSILKYDQGYENECTTCPHLVKWKEDDSAYGHTIRRDFVECQLSAHQHIYECPHFLEKYNDIKNVEDVEVV
jgi:hypothetical protein